MDEEGGRDKTAHESSLHNEIAQCTACVAQGVAVVFIVVVFILFTHDSVRLQTACNEDRAALALCADNQAALFERLLESQAQVAACAGSVYHHANATKVLVLTRVRDAPAAVEDRAAGE